MKEKILKLKNDSSLYEVALDIGISETSLYNYINFDIAGEKVMAKIKKYFEEDK